MRLLIDTHMMLWWLLDDPRLSSRARRVLEDGSTELVWSIASSWEIAVKLSIGKLELGRPVTRLYADIVGEQGVEVAPITHDHCARLCELPHHHKDPFDRLLIVQAQHARIPILTADPKFSAYDVEVMS